MDGFLENLNEMDIDLLRQVINLIEGNGSTETLNSTNIDNNNSTDNIAHGCKHYLRKCKIRTPCCNKIYTCRLCHNEAVSEEYLNKMDPDQDEHKLDRHSIKKIICMNCNKEQEIKQYCEDCEICFGFYFCDICNLFDDVDKGQFHCDKCGLCRKGGKENYFHCDKCNMCKHIDSKDNHKCIDISSTNCPICMSDLFTSTNDVMTMKCGHHIHKSCYISLIRTNYKCPLCMKTTIDVSYFNKVMDQEIMLTPMPEEYKDIVVDIFCNDCSKKSKAKFHIVGHKCKECMSYNTRKL